MFAALWIRAHVDCDYATYWWLFLQAILVSCAVVTNLHLEIQLAKATRIRRSRVSYISASDLKL